MLLGNRERSSLQGAFLADQACSSRSLVFRSSQFHVLYAQRIKELDHGRESSLLCILDICKDKESREISMIVVRTQFIRAIEAAGSTR